jgi:hypothetical protein
MRTVKGYMRTVKNINYIFDSEDLRDYQIKLEISELTDNSYTDVYRRIIIVDTDTDSEFIFTEEQFMIFYSLITEVRNLMVQNECN